MASKNKLLGSGKIEEEVPEIKEVPQVKAPAWRYHESCPEGKIFKTDEALVKADQDGWVDHPGKVRKLAGHEHLFDGQ